LSDAWVNLGLIQAETGKIEDAVVSYKKALEIDSTNVHAICNLGNANYGMGHIADGTAMYKKALKLDPNNQEALYNMGVAFADAQIYHEAINYWKKVVTVDSTSTVAESARGSIQVLQDFLDQQKKSSAQTTGNQ